MQLVLDVAGLSAGYDRSTVLENVTFSIPNGTITGIVGPNGAGKSTLLKTMLGLLDATAGRVRFFGGSLEAHRPDVAYMPQSITVDHTFPVTVLDVVLMGTYPRLGWIRRPRSRERQRSRDALVEVGLEHLSDRPIGSLSGGQRQRVFLARALAQDPELLIMDEPFQGVDAVSEATIIDALRALRGAGKTVIMVHHDLGTVPAYCDRVVLLNRRILGSGPTDQEFTPSAVRELFGIPATEEGSHD